MTAAALAGLTLGDFRDRVRRPVHLAVLLAAVGLGLLAVPPADGHWVIMAIGDHRGAYNSAYVGTATALAGALWLTLGGFYVVRKGIARDEETRVGRLLAATPVRSPVYLVSKFLSSLLVLGSMLGVLVLTAVALQLVRGEDRTVQPLVLLKPFVVFALPLIVLTAAAAVFFETVPGLRGGAGNVVWFFVALLVSIGGQSAAAPFGGLGVGQVSESMGEALARQAGSGADRTFSLGLTEVSTPLTGFRWEGAAVSSEFLLSRLLIVSAAVALVLLSALWFDRFDTARTGSGERASGASGAQPARAAPTASAPLTGPGPSSPTTSPHGGILRTAPARGGSFGRLLAGELRILLGGLSRWWWLGAALLTVGGLVLRMTSVTAVLLPAVWVWPVLIWSRLGCRQVESGLEGLLGAYPAVRRRLLAEWGAGVLLTALTGAAPLIRMAVGADAAGVGAWLTGVVFIPSLALFLGTVCRTHRVFQALYLPLWYLALNGVAALDFMGAVRRDGEPAGPMPLFLAASAVLLAVTYGVAGIRRNVRE